MLVTLVKAPDTLMAAFGWDICLVASPLEDDENPLRSSPTLFDGKSQKIRTEWSCGAAEAGRSLWRSHPNSHTQLYSRAKVFFSD